MYQRLLALSRFRVFSFLLIGFMVALIAATLAVFIILTSLCLPFFIGPLFISAYVTLFVYVTWSILRSMMKRTRSWVNSLKNELVEHMKEIRRKSSISHVVQSYSSSRVLSPIQSPQDEPGEDNEKTSIDESVSSAGGEEETQEVLRHLNVRSVSHKNKKTLCIFIFIDEVKYSISC